MDNRILLSLSSLGIDPQRGRHRELHQFGPGTSPKDIFKDFRARRAAILKALTTDVEKFYQECDPAEKQELSLYGYSDGNWQVIPPAEDAPSRLPEPVVGINFSRSMPRMAWLELCAVHSDSWLLSLSFFYAIRCGFNEESRGKLFELINSLPTIQEIVCKNKTPMERKNSTGSSEVLQASPPTQRKEESIKNMHKRKGAMKEEESDQEEEDEGGSEPCGYCGDVGDDIDYFWIFCDFCNQWFHGQCVGITPAAAKHIKHYKCHKCEEEGRPALK